MSSTPVTVSSKNRKKGQAAEAKGVGDFQALPADPDRVQVQEDVVEHDQRLLARR
jgi:hypothetical protein